jgi:hypothetical protein
MVVATVSQTRWSKANRLPLHHHDREPDPREKENREEMTMSNRIVQIRTGNKDPVWVRNLNEEVSKAVDLHAISISSTKKNIARTTIQVPQSTRNVLAQDG